MNLQEFKQHLAIAIIAAIVGALITLSFSKSQSTIENSGIYMGGHTISAGDNIAYSNNGGNSTAITNTNIQDNRVAVIGGGTAVNIVKGNSVNASQTVENNSNANIYINDYGYNN